MAPSLNALDWPEKEYTRERDVDEEYVMVIHWLALFLVFGSLAEIYVRKKGLGVKTDRFRDGRVVTNRLSIVPPIALMVLAAIIAVVTLPS